MIKKMILLISVSVVSCVVYAQGTWQQKTNCPAAVRAYGPISFTIGKKAYVGLGGLTSTYMIDLWEWNSETDTWTQKADAPSSRSFAPCYAVNGKGYVTTGSVSTSTFAQNWRYDTLTNVWTNLNAFPGAVRQESAVFVINDKVYFGAGCKSSTSVTYYKDFWEYNPIADSWTQKADMPLTRAGGVAFVINGKGYVGLGYAYTTTGTYLKDLWEYNPTTDTWVQKSSMPVTKGKIIPMCFVIDNYAYVVGGYNGSTDTQDVWQYNPANDTWTQKANIIGGGRSGASSFALNGKGYVCFGRNAGVESNSFLEYTPDIVSTNAEETNVLVSKISPNPVRDISVLSISNSDSQKHTIRIYNLMGDIIKVMDSNHLDQIIIDRKDYKKGIYIYQLISDDQKQVSFGKFVVE